MGYEGDDEREFEFPCKKIRLSYELLSPGSNPQLDSSFNPSTPEEQRDLDNPEGQEWREIRRMGANTPSDALFACGIFVMTGYPMH